MSIRNTFYRTVRPRLAHFTRLRNLALEVYSWPGLARHTVAHYLPSVIRPEPRDLTVAITAQCNLRCLGCRYGRDFMPQAQLPWPMVRDLLDDAHDAGFRTVRLYGGEPLLHADLPKMVEHGVRRGLHVYITTNGVLLREKVDALYAAGLRELSIGFYGQGEAYDRYVQRQDRFTHLEAGLSYVRQKYGQTLRVSLSWLLMRPTCNITALHEAYAFAERYKTSLYVDLIHYSLPYFTDGPDHFLQFRTEDRPAIDQVVTELLRLQQCRPDLFGDNALALRSIPDWLLQGPGMRVPCDAYRMIWVGADGTVQLCYVTFKLGNLHETRLRTMLFTSEHTRASRDAYALRCPNCHCHRQERLIKDWSSRKKYSRSVE